MTVGKNVGCSLDVFVCLCVCVCVCQYNTVTQYKWQMFSP